MREFRKVHKMEVKNKFEINKFILRNDYDKTRKSDWLSVRPSHSNCKSGPSWLWALPLSQICQIMGDYRKAGCDWPRPKYKSRLRSYLLSPAGHAQLIRIGQM